MDINCGFLSELVTKWYTCLPTSTVEKSPASTSTDLPEFNSNGEEHGDTARNLNWEKRLCVKRTTA